MGTPPSANQWWLDRAAARSPIVQRSRDRSIRQAKQIVDAAIDLIGEKGSSFTIKELAKHAGIALQTFYRHFSGKDELLLAVIEEVVGESMVTLEALAQDLPNPLDRLRFYITAIVTSLDDESLSALRRFITAEHYRLHQLFPHELSEADRAFTDLLIPEIRAATDAGLLAPHDIDASAWLITELAMATFHHYAYATSKPPPGELAESLWQFCLGALGGTRTDPVPRRRRPPAKKPVA
ncbi:MAG TPA: TetR/AcrR family transcriptional regulator [Acidimicrobiales bacterium]